MRLTIGIPTQGKRPGRLQQAIGSALAQTVPVKVLVKGYPGTTTGQEITSRYKDHPSVRYVEGPADTCWENWTATVEQSDTEFFAWLQDDDVVAPHFAARVLMAFDAFPRAAVYLGRLGISHGAGMANWWQSTGPLVPMDLLYGIPSEIHGSLLAVGAYFTSHALSPGVAFRRAPEALNAVRSVPTNADLYAERSILAELGRLGTGVCDPAIIGYWCHHEGNLSREQNLSADGPRQYRVLLGHIDSIIGDFPNWRDTLRGWAMLAGEDNVRHYLKTTEDFVGDSETLREARSLIAPFAGAVPDFVGEMVAA